MDRAYIQRVFSMGGVVGVVLCITPLTGYLGFIFWNTDSPGLVFLGMGFLLISGIALVTAIVLGWDFLRFLIQLQAFRSGVTLEGHIRLPLSRKVIPIEEARIRFSKRRSQRK